MIKVLELFAGIGACSKALTNLGIEHEIVDAVEVDKYAIKSFNAIHGTSFEAQDIMEWDKDIDVDLIMHGSPCQDFSVAGKGAGGDEGSGTRSSLLYETLRIVEKLRPKYVIWENVKNLLSKKHRHNFDAYIESMRRLGYVSSFQVLNAKDYGIPQNRERVFTVSIREDVEYNNSWDNNVFEFPKPFPLEKRLKDVLEDEVDESYFLSDERLKTIAVWEQRQKDNGRGFRFEVKTGDDIGRAITTNGDRPCSTNYVKDLLKKSIKVRTANKLGYDEAYNGAGGGHVPMHDYDLRVRRLTPKECWRLMGFDDTDFRKAEKVNSNTQLYKQAGNSIVVNVLEAILEELLHGSTN